MTFTFQSFADVTLNNTTPDLFSMLLVHNVQRCGGLISIILSSRRTTLHSNFNANKPHINKSIACIKIIINSIKCKPPRQPDTRRQRTRHGGGQNIIKLLCWGIYYGLGWRCCCGLSSVGQSAMQTPLCGQ